VSFQIENLSREEAEKDWVSQTVLKTLSHVPLSGFGQEAAIKDFLT